MNITEHPIFEGCYEKICQITNDRLLKECRETDDIKKKKAKERYREELSAIKKTGLAPFFFLNYMVVNYANSMNTFVSVAGQVSYSYIAYLLGITEIDPLERNYPAKMAFSHNMNLPPLTDIKVPTGFVKKIMNYLGKLFGEEFVRRDNCFIIVGDPDENRLTWIYLVVNRDYLVTLADRILTTKYGDCDSGTFLEERGRILSGYYALDADGLKSVTWEALHSVITSMIVTINKADNIILFDPDGFCRLLDDTNVEKAMWLFALINGVGVFKSIYEYHNEGVITRDDVYSYLVKAIGDDDGEAYKLMEDIRKGKGNTDAVQDTLEAYGIDDKFRELIKPIEFMSLEATCYIESYVVFFIAANSYDTGDSTRV